MIKLTLTQQPYLDGTNEHPIYTAAAVDEEGESYWVHWTVRDEYKKELKIEDESDACEWDVYEAIIKDGEYLDVKLFDVHDCPI